MRLPRATWLHAMSKMTGGCLPAGTATASGLLPILGTTPPQGAITGLVMLMTIPIIWWDSAMAAM